MFMNILAQVAADAAPIVEPVAEAVASGNGNIGIGIGIAGALIGAGIGLAGAARGIGNIGGNAVEAIARQPEAKGAISGNMIIAAALIEGATLFALVIALVAIVGGYLK